jgi:exodeoxyribonuclease VII large subunit
MVLSPGLPPARAAGARAGVWSVSALVLAVGDALVARFPAVTVVGEISGFSRASSGHCYFALKDGSGAPALIRCALFRRAATLLAFQPRDGHQVEVRGRLGVYEPRGELQLVVESIQQAGQGALMERFLQLKAQLQAEGLFDGQSKRPWPRFVRSLGVVTSLEAAALHDVMASLRRRAPHVSLVIYPALVQGPQAPEALARALAEASQRAEVDALILCRGGGSLEDLWAFNEAAVVRAVAACVLPVVTGIGHETDVSLCDFAADLHAPTPTAAAELAVPSRAECLAALGTLAHRLTSRLHLRLDQQSQRLDRLSLRLRRPGDGVAQQRQRLDRCAARLIAAVQGVLPRCSQALSHREERLLRAVAVRLAHEQRVLSGATSRLNALNPERVLQRGYAWLSRTDGRAVVSVHQIEAGQALRAHLADGQADLQVCAVQAPNPARQQGLDGD